MKFRSDTRLLAKHMYTTPKWLEARVLSLASSHVVNGLPDVVKSGSSSKGVYVCTCLTLTAHHTAIQSVCRQIDSPANIDTNSTWRLQLKATPALYTAYRPTMSRIRENSSLLLLRACMHCARIIALQPSVFRTKTPCKCFTCFLVLTL